ncbi:MAG: TetR/AcrR family transcriptional regulator C-terminal domain-containing protein, partial [Planctomycetota bacterium]
AKQDGRLSVTNIELAATQFTSLIKAFAFWPQIISDEPAPTKRERSKIAKNTTEMFLSQYQI